MSDSLLTINSGVSEGEKELAEKKLNVMQTIAESNLTLSRALNSPISTTSNMITHCNFSGFNGVKNLFKSKKKG